MPYAAYSNSCASSLCELGKNLICDLTTSVCNCNSTMYIYFQLTFSRLMFYLKYLGIGMEFYAYPIQTIKSLAQVQIAIRTKI